MPSEPLLSLPTANTPDGSEFYYCVQGGADRKITGAAIIGTAANARVQRSINSGANLPIRSTDSILNFNASLDLTPTVPAASSRNGFVLTFKNLPGGHTQTFGRTGSDTFDGQTTLVLSAGAAITLVPYNDGVNTGWAIA